MHNGRAERATGTAANLIPKLRFSLAFLLAFGLGAQRLPDVPNADVDAIVKPITWPPFTPPPAIHMVKPQKAWGACSANKSSKPPPCTYIMYMTETEAACRFRRLAELAIAMKHAALLRGINVGGKNPLPMKDLTRMFEAAGGRNVRTYIQSGNVIFKAAASSSKIGEAVTKSIEKQFGYWIPVILRTSEQLQKAISGNPFVAAGADQKALHVYFLSYAPSAASCESLDASRFAPDAFEVRGREIYLHLPNGMGRTKLTNAYFDSQLSTTCTARNWATVLKLAEMMR